MNESLSPILLSGGFSLHPYTQLEAEQFAVSDAQTFDAYTTEDIRMFLPGLPIFSGTSAEKYFSFLPLKGSRIKKSIDHTSKPREYLL